MQNFLLYFIMFSLLIGSENGEELNRLNKSYKVIAYVRGINDDWGPNYKMAKKLTHINYAFANIKDGKVVEGRDSDAENLRWLRQLKKINPELKILVSVGGWSWSDNFSDAVVSPDSREIFANSIVDFIKKHQLDGIDLDWEYPGLQGEDNIHRPEDKENFTAVLKLIKEKLNEQLPKQNLLTIASASFPDYFSHTELEIAHKYLDFINIMSYDYYTGGGSKTGHHSNFEVSEYNATGTSTKTAIQRHLDLGIPKEKLVVGVPFYGRFWKGTNPENNGLFQESTGERGSWNYHVLLDSLKSDATLKQYWDSSASAPYLWRAKDSCFVTYEDTTSLGIKTKYVRENGLGGIMFWQFGGDNGDLLTVIDKVLTE